jgi:hypothetical protein
MSVDDVLYILLMLGILVLAGLYFMKHPFKW